MRLTNSGNVGIGTTAPTHLLDVRGQTRMTTGGNYDVWIQGGAATSGDTRHLAILGQVAQDKLYINYSSEYTNGTVIGGDTVMQGSVGIGMTPSRTLDVNGTTRTQVLEIVGGSDLSEKFDITTVGTEPQPGHVVCIDPENPGKLIVSTKAYDRTVAGIISGAGGVTTGMTMGQQGSVANGSQPVALTGRVYAWADASNGAIEPGDLLTTSDIAGHLMKVTDFERSHGAVLGKAMTRLAAGQRGLVLVLVGLQ